MKRGYVYAGIAGTLLLLLWLVRAHQDRKVDESISTPTLQKDDRAKYVFDPKAHTITKIDRQFDGSEKVTKTFLNTHGPVAVVEKKDGSTVLIQRTWGTEVSPFIGGAFGSDIRMRAALGLDLFYVQRWELGGGLLVNTDIHDTRLFAHVSYNVYGNAYISLGIDNRHTAQFMAGLKF